MFKDCLRMATVMKVVIEPPASHPFNPLHALRASLLDMDEDVRRRLVTRLFAATWAESRDVGAPEVVAEICAEVGVSNALERIRDASVKQQLFDASAAAVARGVFGVPTMIVDDEAFWGVDSFPHLKRYLAGEDPVTPEHVARWAAVPATAQRRSKP
jgi:2-hydroxychromene-2-carboxylate isomerase